MRGQELHSWDVTVEEATEIQNRLRPLVQKTNSFQIDQLKTVAGVDISLKDEGQAAVVVLSFPELEVVDRVIGTRKVTFPYVPGFLSFREAPLLLSALEKLKVQPDLLMLDGQGYAHPRRFGIACHIGIILDMPTIGCAKSVLVGHYKEPGPERGDQSPMLDKGEVVGVVLRTKLKTKPMFISIGNQIDLPTAVDLVLRCGRGYRLPETTRLADKYSRAPNATPLTELTTEPNNPTQGQLF